jgi:NAD(P)-dependent dehydrogenase (short-subunit alcohol dehydrogenase family)
MTTLNGRNAVVLGGSSGVGKAVVSALVAERVRVTAVARGAERLQRLRSALGDAQLDIVQGDAANPDFLATLIRDRAPDFVVLAAGVTPRVAAIDTFDWEEFSEAWNSDLKAAFHLVSLALTMPLRPGATIVLVSSGAAVRGSPLSGGYAGAKRMQWFLATYAQAVSDARQLGLRFIAVVPEQLIEGTTIAGLAAAGYAAVQGITAEEFMGRYAIPLTTTAVATAILDALRGPVADGATVIGLRGGALAALA